MKWIIPYDGTDWYYQDDRRPTIYEATLIQEISGLVGDDLTRALAGENPRAWLAILVVARKRSGMPTDRARKVDADRVEMEDAVNATYEEMQRVKAAKATEAADGPQEASAPGRRARTRRPAAVPAEGASAAEDTPAA